jgi:hypothetical protein
LGEICTGNKPNTGSPWSDVWRWVVSTQFICETLLTVEQCSSGENTTRGVIYPPNKFHVTEICPLKWFVMWYNSELVILLASSHSINTWREVRTVYSSQNLRFVSHIYPAVLCKPEISYVSSGSEAYPC